MARSLLANAARADPASVVRFAGESAVALIPRRPFGHMPEMLRKKVILSGADVVVAVCRYAPGERHSRHTDRHSRISLLIRGRYREDGRPGGVDMRPGHVLLKSRRATHADEFGPDGATIAAIEFTDHDPFDSLSRPDLWRRRDDGFAMRHATTVLDGAIAGDRHTAKAAGFDLVAASDGDSSRADSAPGWLVCLKQELESVSLSGVDVAARAKAAGAHPAHASRLFRRCYGVSVTEHAQAHGVRRAIDALAGGAALGDAALAAGFYDQSHMTRVFGRVTGRTPGAYRAMLRSALG